MARQMHRVDRRVYAPPVYARGPVDEDDAPPRRQMFIFGLMFVTVAAFSGVVWGMYHGGEAPRVTAPDGDYRSRPAADAGSNASVVESALYDDIEGKAGEAPVAAAPAPEQPVEDAAPQQPAAPSAEPRLTADGPYLAQIAAIQSENGVNGAWRRVAERAPALFEGARMDVERADLGARGVYYRVRAGYFPDRANAAMFCDRVRLLGQDCLVVAR